MAGSREHRSAWRVVRSLPGHLLLMGTLLGAANGVTLLDPNSLPSCAMNCYTLNAADDGCVPPAALVTDHATYLSCFCQSALLTTLYKSPKGICDSECAGDSSALDELQQWYTGLCQNDGAAPVPVPTTSSTTTSTAPTAGATTDSSSSATTSDESSGSWVSSHWQWILFIVIVVVAILLLALLLLWFKKRHRRRRDARMGNVSGSLSAPSPNDTRSFAGAPPMSSMSGANASNPSVIPAPPAAQSRNRSSSLRQSTFTASRDSLPAAVASWGRSRSGSRPGSGIQGPAPVWGPHQNQHHTKGYGYGDSEVEIPPTPVSRAQSDSWNARSSWGPTSTPHGGGGGLAQPHDALKEEEEEEDRPHTADGPVSSIGGSVRRKLSKRRP